MTHRPSQDRTGIVDAFVAVRLAARAAPVAVAVQLAAGLSAGAAPVAAAWLTKLLLDGLTTGSVGQGVLAVVGLLVGVTVVAALVPLIGTYASGELNRRVRVLVQKQLFTAVGRMPGLARLEDPAFHDHLRLADQSGRESPGLVVTGALGTLQGALTLIGFLTSLAVLSPAMALVVVVAAAPVLVAELALGRRRASMLWRIGPAERRGLFYADLLKDLQAAKEIRLFGIGALLRDRMLGELRSTNDAKRRTDRHVLRTQGGLALLSALVSGGGLVWAAQAALAGRLSIGDVTVFIAAVAGTQGALRSVVLGLARAHEALLVFGHYLHIVRTPPDLPVPDRPTPVPALRHGIEFRDVWFRYGEDKPWVLRGVELFIPHGHAVALVGRNGAGKSTLVKLLCRFYDPTRGAVLWDGVDIREFDPSELRDRLSAVFQDYMSYDLTAAENIGIGEPSALGDSGRIEAAARRAGAHEVLAGLPSGYRTLLSRTFFDNQDEDPSAGVLLSGGQWQRVALARALVRGGRDLLVLDEPSSGLDAESEHEIHTRLREHRAGQTSLLISHRLGALRDADLIVVLVDGYVTEQGTHAELSAIGGTYAHLFSLQSRGYRADTAAP
ncbi:ABC transporter ATP-binding protein [Streptomyces echinatus]|uniref:ABC transporter ATP-binding protein n=1 Tax=Streptomyces echinatus TaxID=67293 RepID=UPI003824F743